MKKFNKLIILYMVAIMIFLPLRVLGASSVTIDINTKENLSKSDLDGRTVAIWKINPKFIDTSMEKSMINSILEDFTNDELDRQLENSSYKWIVHTKEENNYNIILKDLDPGLYYVREIGGENRDRVLIPFVFSPGETNIIDVKWAKKETPPPNPEKPPHKPPEEEEKKKKDNPPDSLLLKKVDEKGSSLAGAKFTLHYANGDFVKTKNGKVDENGSVEEFVTDDSGEILIESIEPGAYFMKEVEAPKGYEITNDKTIFAMFKDDKKVVTVENKRRTGTYKFFKTDETRETGLVGAKFVITEDVNNKNKRIQRDGKDLVLNSGEDGNFDSTELPYGTYYIWETKAPDGYNLLEGGLKFEIDDDSDEEVLFIENSKKSPLPKTGDITLIVLVIAGAIMIALGKYLVKDKN